MLYLLTIKHNLGFWENQYKMASGSTTGLLTLYGYRSLIWRSSPYNLVTNGFKEVFGRETNNRAE
jgi:hypothetical protein